jgi:hypothetical protein
MGQITYEAQNRLWKKILLPIQVLNCKRHTMVWYMPTVQVKYDCSFCVWGPGRLLSSCATETNYKNGRASTVLQPSFCLFDSK